MTKTIEHNVQTGEIIERDFTTDEISDFEKTKAIVDQAQAAEEAKQIEKAALLQQLGITADQVKLLLS